jgi:hypothetical protein
MASRKNLLFFSLLVSITLSLPSGAQQTLGSITGTVSDTTGAVIQQAEIALVNNLTGLVKSGTSRNDGSFDFPNLPIGTYTLTFTHVGFRKEVHDQVLVQANRTTSVLVKLQPGGGDTAIEVTATPLLNRVDTTNGYVMNSAQIETVPLGTGSFTQLAVLSPGVNADFLSGTDTNAGLGNQAIFANGQRDTSNSFTVNSVLATNLFNGKSTSGVGGNRISLNTGENFLAGGQIQTNTSVYDAIGQALPSPPQETIEELRVNTSQYDASQGANSGAHIEVQTRTGTNNIHGQIYGQRQSDDLNAAPYFFKQDPTIPSSLVVPKLHRGLAGGTIGGPLIKNKLFYFASYQWTTVHDQLNAIQQIGVPVTNAAVNCNTPQPVISPGLTQDRSISGLTALATALNCNSPVTLDPVAVRLLQFKLPNGQLLIPSAGALNSLGTADQTLLGPPSTFTAHQANANIDYNFNSKDQLFARYYIQDVPISTPFSNGGNTFGFPQNLEAGSQVFSLQNVNTPSSNLSWEQKVGFIRERVFSTAGQPLTPADVGINLFGSQRFPGIFINQLGDGSPLSGNSFSFGPTSNFANTGFFQNQLEATSNLNLIRGRQTFAFGANYDYTQLNVINRASQVAQLDFGSFLDFLRGTLRPGLGNTALFNGPTNRYYRANQVGAYAQDKVRLSSTLNLTFGVRYDWDGPLTEKNGNLINFNPAAYKFDLASDTIINDGLVVAGNNKQFGTAGASDSTLKGRQYGFAPRVGIAWSPSFVRNVVVRAGFGLYYDRGEFFTEFSPSAGFGFNGPFGVTLQPPFVQPVAGTSSGTFTNPFGATPPPGPPNSPQAFAAQLPNLAALANGATPFLFGGYDPRNKLPYSENFNLDLQWQPANDMVVTLAYIGNRGLHETLPIPFNQPQIATPQNPVNGQTSSYGYNVTSTETIFSSTGGNTDLRVPFVGYSPNSVFYEAEGISSYHSLQAQFIKRFSRGLQANVSYTYSHTLDEGSGLGLFFNGNNPLDPRRSYGSSDFDRTHVVTFSYVYQLPKFSRFHGVADKVLNGWGISGVTTFESGQPYSIIDFSGSIGSLFFSNNDFLTNPIVPLAPGFTPKTALTGHVGSVPGFPALNPAAFAPQFLQPGQDGVPLCDPTGGPSGGPLCDTFESAFGSSGRNLFRGPFQKRADLSFFKETTITERVHAKYSFDIFNVSNTPSFDTPNNNVSFFSFGNPPTLQVPPQGNLGAVQHPLGSPRLIRMAIHFTF